MAEASPALWSRRTISIASSRVLAPGALNRSSTAPPSASSPTPPFPAPSAARAAVEALAIEEVATASTSPDATPVPVASAAAGAGASCCTTGCCDSEVSGRSSPELWLMRSARSNCSENDILSTTSGAGITASRSAASPPTDAEPLAAAANRSASCKRKSLAVGAMAAKTSSAPPCALTASTPASSSPAPPLASTTAQSPGAAAQGSTMPKCRFIEAMTSAGLHSRWRCRRSRSMEARCETSSNASAASAPPPKGRRYSGTRRSSWSYVNRCITRVENHSQLCAKRPQRCFRTPEACRKRYLRLDGAATSNPSHSTRLRSNALSTTPAEWDRNTVPSPSPPPQARYRFARLFGMWSLNNNAVHDSSKASSRPRCAAVHNSLKAARCPASKKAPTAARIS
mmetsp:Transcript_41961/g.115761  ORF Transcript_41961/g.115761 Transcript_41961/m.115761 type:complete len:399 (+) Transcript_41961:1013-2209(+)